MTAVSHIFGVMAAVSFLAAVEFERREAPTWIALVLGADGVLAGVTALVIGGGP
jgi:CHASE1-domain containing sensor protein